MFRRVDGFVGDAHLGCCTGSRRRPPQRARSRSRRPPTRLPLAPASSRQRARRGRPGSPWLRVARRRCPPRFAPSRRCRRRRRRRMPLASRPSPADCAATVHDTRGRESHVFKGASHTAGAPRRRGLASSFVNALCFLQSAKDQIIGSIGPFLRDARPRLGVNPARRTRALNRRDLRPSPRLFFFSFPNSKPAARLGKIKPRPPPTRRRSR